LILFDITSLLLSNKHHPFQHRNNRLLRWWWSIMTILCNAYVSIIELKIMESIVI
jgi:hypothetical protein